MSNTTSIQNASSELLQEVLFSFASTEAKKQEEAKAPSSQAKAGKKLLELVDPKNLGSHASKEGVNEAIMQALALIEKLEILMTVLHNKDVSNQSEMGKIATTNAQNQEHLLEEKIQEMQLERRDAKRNGEGLKILSYVIGVVALAAAAFMGPGAFLITAAMFSLQVSGETNKLTAHMGLGAKIGLTLAFAAAGGLTAGAVDAAVGQLAEQFASSAVSSASEEAVENAVDEQVEEASSQAANQEKDTTFDAKKQFKSSFKSGTYNTFAQSLAIFNPLEALFEKMGMSKKGALVLSSLLTALIALAATLQAAKGSTNVLDELLSSGKVSALEKLSRISQGFMGPALGAKAYFGYEQYKTYDKMAELTKAMAPINALLALMHDILEKVESLVKMSSQTESQLIRPFADEIKSLGAISLTWEQVARVLTNSPA